MTKEDLKNYYRNLKEITILQKKIEHLQLQREKIIDNINNGNVILKADIQAVNYNDTATSKSLLHTSPQEKAIDKAYKELDEKQNILYLEIIQTEILISDLKILNADIEYFLQTLDSEDLKLIELYFKERRTSLQISFALNMSVSTVHRKINKILKEYSEIYER